MGKSVRKLKRGRETIAFPAAKMEKWLIKSCKHGIKVFMPDPSSK